MERGPGAIADGRLARKALGEHPWARRPVRFARLATDQSDAGLGWISVRVNFIPKNEARVADAYEENYERLATIERRFDRSELFRANQNIAPRLETGTFRFSRLRRAST